MCVRVCLSVHVHVSMCVSMGGPICAVDVCAFENREKKFLEWNLTSRDIWEVYLSLLVLGAINQPHTFVLWVKTGLDCIETRAHIALGPGAKSYWDQGPNRI